MHKKSIEAAKALKEEDGGCDGSGAANGSESVTARHDQSLPVVGSSAIVGASRDGVVAPSAGRRSVDLSPAGAGGKGGGVEDALRSESIAALRAKV